MTEREQSDSTQQPQEPHFHHSPDQTELERLVGRFLTRLEPYSSQILIGCLLLSVVAVGAILFFRSAGASQSLAWQRFVQSRVAEDYLQVANERPNEAIGQWARLQAARMFLDEGLNQAITDRAASDDRLNKAKDEFDRLLKSKTGPEIREAALYGMATALEALSAGDLQPAITAYEELLQQFPDSQHAGWAKARIEALKSPESQEFYAWFRTTTPKPSDRPLPQDIPALPPAGELEFPELSMPPKTSSTPVKVPGETALPFPAELDKAPASAGDRPPAPATPETVPPESAEKPAAEEKPAPASDSQESKVD